MLDKLLQEMREQAGLDAEAEALDERLRLVTGPRDPAMSAAKLKGRTTAMEQPVETVVALWSIEAVKLLDRRMEGNGHKAMSVAQKNRVQKALGRVAVTALRK